MLNCIKKINKINTYVLSKWAMFSRTINKKKNKKKS